MVPSRGQAKIRSQDFKAELGAPPPHCSFTKALSDRSLASFFGNSDVSVPHFACLYFSFFRAR